MFTALTAMKHGSIVKILDEREGDTLVRVDRVVARDTKTGIVTFQCYEGDTYRAVPGEAVITKV